jgi:hypothetical protein
MATDWHQTLSRVSGAVVNGEERITTHELLTHLGVPYSDRAARKLKRIMRRLGWRARKIRLGRETRNGYYRKIGAGIISQSPGLPGPRAAEAPLARHPGDMAAELEAVAQLGLKNLRDILTLPLDVEDGPLLRAKNAAANTILNTQTKVDENQPPRGRTSSPSCWKSCVRRRSSTR